MQTGVVTHVDGRVAEFCGQSVAVLGRPLQVVHTQAVDEDEHFTGDRSLGRQGLPIQHRALKPQRHLGGQRVAAGEQAVTHHAVQRGQHGFALGGLGGGGVGGCQQGLQPRQGLVGTRVQKLRHAVDAFVDQAGDAPGLIGRFAGRCAQGVPDRLVHALGNPRHTARGLGGELHHGARV